MDANSIRAHLAEARKELDEIDERREALTGLVKSYETLLRLSGDSAYVPTDVSPPVKSPYVSKAGVTKGRISLQKAALSVLKDAQGAPLRSREIFERALQLGAMTEAKNPLGAIDLSCYHLMQEGHVEKVGPRLWRWVDKAATGGQVELPT